MSDAEQGILMQEAIPEFPEIPDSVLARCAERGDYRDVLFEYYRFTAMLTVVVSSLLFENKLWNGGSRRKWTALVGLLTRCHRLMAANLEFFQNDRYGEATLIVDRCLIETAIKVRWISQDHTEARLRRYLEDSIKTDVELGQIVRENIAARNGVAQRIESRMLRSIRRHMDDAGIQEDEIPALRKMPDFAAMIRDVGEVRLMYTVIMKMGSHHIHGTWGSLLSSYLVRDDNGNFRPNSDAIPSHVNQYAMHPVLVLTACRDFLAHCFRDAPERDYLLAVLEHASDQILRVFEREAGVDREPEEQNHA